MWLKQKERFQTGIQQRGIYCPFQLAKDCCKCYSQNISNADQNMHRAAYKLIQIEFFFIVLEPMHNILKGK